MIRLLIAISVGLMLFAKYSNLLFSDDITYTNVYMLCHSISWFWNFVAIRLLVKDYFSKAISEVAIILWASEILDELFFNPVEIQVNEVVLLIIAFCVLFYRIGNSDKT